MMSKSARIPANNEISNSFRKNVIRVGAGFVANERPHVVETLSTLGRI